MLKKILIISLLIFFINCNKTLDLFNGGINNVTIGYDGKTIFNPAVGSVVQNQAGTTPQANPSSAKTQTPAVAPTPVVTPVVTPTTKDVNALPPSIPGVSSADPSSQSSSLLEGLPDLSKSFFFTERESIGMPRVNGERIEADLYGNNILIIKYSSPLIKIRYSQDIKNIDKLGKVQGQNARVEYPTSFIKIFFKDTNGDTSVKIFGIVEN